MQVGAFSPPGEIYSKVLRVFATKLNPFFREHYFGNKDNFYGGFNANKKAVVISFLTKARIFDQDLYSNFTRHFSLILT